VGYGHVHSTAVEVTGSEYRIGAKKEGAANLRGGETRVESWWGGSEVVEWERGCASGRGGGWGMLTGTRGGRWIAGTEMRRYSRLLCWVVCKKSSDYCHGGARRGVGTGP